MKIVGILNSASSQSIAELLASSLWKRETRKLRETVKGTGNQSDLYWSGGTFSPKICAPASTRALC